MYQSELRDNSKYVHQTSGLTTVTRRGVSKIVVPPSLRPTILREAHQKFNHPGISQLTRIISAQYFWSGMSIDIRAFVKNCNICQMSKTPKGPKYGELGELPESPLPFDLVSMDTIAGFARYGSAKYYLHVVVDHATRFAWTFPSRSTSTNTYIQVIKKVLQSGCPKRLLTDRAPAFTSPRFRRFLISHNIQPMLTTSNHPQANGLSERLNATLTGKLRLLHLQHPRASWTMLQSKVVKAYNDTPHSVTGFPPSYLMDGSLPKELSQHLDPYPSVTESRRLALQRTKERHKLDKIRFDKNHRSPDFEVGDLVLTKIYQHPNTGKLVPYFSGPYEIIEVISPYTVRINRPNQAQNLETEIIHVNKLKHYSEDTKYIFTPHSTNNNSKPKSYFIYNHFPPEIFHDDYKNYASTLSNPFNHMNPDIFLDNVEPTLTARYISTPDTIPKIAIRLEPSPTTKIMLPSSPTRNHTPQISPQFSAPLINCDNTKLENSGDFELDNEPHGKPPQKFEDAELQVLLDEDSTQMQEKLAKHLQVSQGAVSPRLNSLGMTQKLSRWVPHEHEKKSFLHRIVTSDEKWIHFSNPTRQKSWDLPGQFPKQTPRPNRFGKKAMLCIWWDQTGVVYFELLKPGKMVNTSRYEQQMHSLREALNEKRPEWREKHNNLILQHDNAPAHNVTVVKNTIKYLGWEL
ncbi:hypothetical protein LAZ67_2002917 [Cordylochernes scorpioides]|uniref:RNA-directed DNA polymerase n=1 Tax=Cordylochernes scorpioides TaxID=51811 RepID=A0ABY6K3I2_9ARAC|nr:hypothetical protein LAZ67_2002917 [Cordylochernes scorpioides]